MSFPSADGFSGVRKTSNWLYLDPHLVAREMAVDVDHPTLGRVRSQGSDHVAAAERIRASDVCAVSGDSMC
jgi:hypothetical protein